jgi:hypothetical protein
MAVRKTIVSREEDGAIFIADTIEYEGKLWIVPEWIEGPTIGTRCPARIICTDGLRLMPAPPAYQADYVLGLPLSRDVLEGRATKLGLDVRTRPDIILRIDTDFLE